MKHFLIFIISVVIFVSATILYLSYFDLEGLERIEKISTIAGGIIVLASGIYGLFVWKYEFGYKKKKELAEEILSQMNHLFVLLSSAREIIKFQNKAYEKALNVQIKSTEFDTINVELLILRKLQSKGSLYFKDFRFQVSINRFLAQIYQVMNIFREVEILYKIEDNNKEQLQYLGYIENEFANIRYDILFNSKNDDSYTANILYSIDEIKEYFLKEL